MKDSVNSSNSQDIMKVFLFISFCVAVCSAIPSVIQEWASFKAKHGKSYNSPNEEHFRLGVYLSNKEMIEEHNSKYESGLVTYQMKMNHFGDKLQVEISDEINGFNKSGQLLSRKPGLTYFQIESLKAPVSIDWRQLGAVTPVKNQGQCGSCWAFSSTGALEGQIFIKTGKLVSLSEQNLVDCATDYGNNGCNGGLMDQAFNYIKDNHGIDSEESYPYEGLDKKCRFKKSSIAGSVSTYVDIPGGDEEALKNAVATVGPISVAINAGLRSFTFYNNGVYAEDKCDPEALNHGVLLVGYGTENGQDYWVIKNSWSSSWGEGGYVKMARNKGNVCGVASMASYPLV